MLRAILGVVVMLGCAQCALCSACSRDRLSVYQLVVTTYWSRTVFPKHFPDWRPPAQWTKTIGRSHDDSYTLFKLGSPASQGLKIFAETGRSEPLDAQSHASRGVFDEFSAPPITSGAGHVDATFFMDGNHSKVSLGTRIVPSPDWFIGIDSFDLCVNGNWIDSVTIELDPVDAGTDNGFTFTAPNWPTEPQGVVYRITHTYPAHPAGSFYYPAMKRLPAIATYKFIKLREYTLAQEFTHNGESDAIIKMEHVTRAHDFLTNDVAQHQDHTPSPHLLKTTSASTSTVLPSHVTSAVLPYHNHNISHTALSHNSKTSNAALQHHIVALPLPRGDKDAILNSIVETYRSNKRPRPLRNKNMRKFRPPRDCRVGEWTAWGDCSKSCGIGEMQRTRHVIKHARRGGNPCPSLVETKWCGSARACNKGYFNW